MPVQQLSCGKQRTECSVGGSLCRAVDFFAVCVDSFVRWEFLEVVICQRKSYFCSTVYTLKLIVKSHPPMWDLLSAVENREKKWKSIRITFIRVNSHTKCVKCYFKHGARSVTGCEHWMGAVRGNDSFDTNEVSGIVNYSFSYSLTNWPIHDLFQAYHIRINSISVTMKYLTVVVYCLVNQTATHSVERTLKCDKCDSELTNNDLR